MNKSYCVLPWIHLAPNTNGDIRPCCVSTDVIRKKDHTPYNLGNDSIEDIFNSPDYVDIRKKMLLGEEVAGCSECYAVEKHNGVSNRLQFNSFGPSFDNPYADVNISYIDLRFGNLCNLNCRSCNPESSSQFSKEVDSLAGSGIEKFHAVNSFDLNSWFQTEMFDKNLNSQLDNIKFLYLTGGEPTVIRKNFDLLESLIALGKQAEVVLHLNSNMTNTNPKFYELIKQFKSVTFFASIDGYGKTQEYIRYPSKWESIDTNFNRLLDLGNNITIVPTPVIQIANLGKCVELFDYFEDFNRQANKSAVNIIPIVLENPKHLDVLHLPRDYKLECWDKINDWLTTSCVFQHNLFYNKLEAVKHKCNEQGDPSRLKTYIEYNTILDKHRKVTLFDSNPELFELLKSINL